MIPDFLRQFNWVDIVVLIFLLRGIYRGARNGIVLELFSLSGWCLAIFLSFKFYKSIAQTLHERTELPLVLDELFAFGAIIFATIILANIVGGILKHVIKIKIVERISLWGGMVLGSLKQAVVLSVIFYGLGILSIPYLEKSIKEKSLSGRAISRVSDVVYTNIEQVLE